MVDIWEELKALRNLPSPDDLKALEDGITQHRPSPNSQGTRGLRFNHLNTLYLSLTLSQLAGLSWQAIGRHLEVPHSDAVMMYYPFSLTTPTKNVDNCPLPSPPADSPPTTTARQDPALLAVYNITFQSKAVLASGHGIQDFLFLRDRIPEYRYPATKRIALLYKNMEWNSRAHTGDQSADTITRECVPPKAPASRSAWVHRYYPPSIFNWNL